MDHLCNAHLLDHLRLRKLEALPNLQELLSQSSWTWSCASHYCANTQLPKINLDFFTVIVDSRAILTVESITRSWISVSNEKKG
jgi:hypothetical protein